MLLARLGMGEGERQTQVLEAEPTWTCMGVRAQVSVYVFFSRRERHTVRSVSQQGTANRQNKRELA